MKRWIWTGGLVACAAIGVVYWYQARPSYVENRPKRGPVLEAVYGIGSVVAPHTFQYKVAVTLPLRKLYVKEGDTVEKGAPLVSLDQIATIRAPFAGTVTSLPFRESELVFPQNPVVTVVNNQDLYLEVALEQEAALRVRPGQNAKVTFESLRGDVRTGRVESVYTKDKQFLIRIEMKEFPTGVLPAMTADVAIVVGEKSDALLIPASAIHAGFVLVKRNGRKSKERIDVGVVDESWAEVLSDNIREGDLVLTPQQNN